MKGLWIAGVLMIAVFALAACAPSPAEMPCPDGSERYDEYRLFFGWNIGDAEGVSDEE